jgi:hypothetical protein
VSCFSWAQAQQKAGKEAKPGPVEALWLLSKKVDSPGASVAASVEEGVAAAVFGRVRVVVGQESTVSAAESFPS